MYELRGRPLLATVSCLTSLGFLLIGFDNGLMGGLGQYPRTLSTFDANIGQSMAMPSTTPSTVQMPPWLALSLPSMRLVVSLGPFLLPWSVNSWVVARVLPSDALS